MDLEIGVVRESDHCVVSPQGEVDVYSSPRLKETLAALIDEGFSQLMVDLSGVGFMDSSGLGAMVSGLRRAKERGGSIVVVGPQEPILKVFRITGLDKAFPICDSLDEARSRLT